VERHKEHENLSLLVGSRETRDWLLTSVGACANLLDGIMFLV